MRIWHRLTKAIHEVRHPRSPHWPRVRAMHLRLESTCQWCKGETHLQVHHVEPYHLFPAKELDASNLLTVCEAPGHDCHLRQGHRSASGKCSWRLWNARIREDVAAHRAKR